VQTDLPATSIYLEPLKKLYADGFVKLVPRWKDLLNWRIITDIDIKERLKHVYKIQNKVRFWVVLYYLINLLKSRKN
jgi:hypothetical protein